SLSFPAFSVAGLPRLGLELVLQNFAIQRTAADVQDAGRFLLVPLHAFEDANDVRTFGLGQRREAVARLLQPRNRRVKELDIGGADGPSGRRQRGTRNRAFELADVAGPL